MADLSILAGATSQSILVDLYILSTGAGQTGLAFNSSGLTAYYSFAGAVAASTAITLVTLATVGTAWASGGFIQIDATNMPGIYRFDIPNAVIAAAKGREVIITFNGFTGMAQRHIKIELTAVDNQSTGFGLVNASANVVQWSGTAVAAPATAGIPEVNVKNMNNVSAAAITTVKAVQGLTTADTIATYTGNTPQTGDNYVRLGAPAGANISADIAAIKSDTGSILTDVGTGAGAIYARLGAPAGASLAADIAAVNSKTTNLPAAPASTTNITAGVITTVTNLTNAPGAGDFTAAMKTSLNAATPVATLSSAYDFAKGNVAMTEAYAAQGAAMTPIQAFYQLVQQYAQMSIAGTTMTVKKRDGSTTAKTYTLDNATTPTTISETT